MKNREIVQVLKLSPVVKVPQYQTEGSAGFDLQSRTHVHLEPGQSDLIGTGVKVALPEGVMMDIRPRSGLAVKYPNYIVNSPGTIDSDYRGEILIGVINNGKTPWNIYPGDRIAQGVLVPVILGRMISVTELPQTERGENGHGSTGV